MRRDQRLYGLRLKGVENTWKSEQSEKEKNGFRTWSVEIGAVPISTRNKRNPYYLDRVEGLVLSAGP
ncbi:hypothetical protein DESA109040_12485 [Deinococcus saxicola]